MDKKYIIYILICIAYPLIKVVFYINDLICWHGLVHGIIAGLFTIIPGFLALREYSGTGKLGHRLAFSIPLIIVIFTPIVMIAEHGTGVFHGGKLTAGIIFEVLAITQVILVLFMFKGLSLKRVDKK